MAKKASRYRGFPVRTEGHMVKADTEHGLTLVLGIDAARDFAERILQAAAVAEKNLQREREDAAA